MNIITSFSHKNTKHHEEQSSYWYIHHLKEKLFH